MNEIRCLSPNIILNKSWHVNKVDFKKGWIIILRGVEYNYVPTPKKARIQKYEVDDCYYLNTSSGEMIPLYLVVPCQKCILCKDKKAVDWATRVTCEGNYHVFCPWWITLTYNNLSLPENGLEKRDFQNFMKRLRERVSRVVNDDIKLRFVGVGEYGGNTVRAHYHSTIYGLPNLPVKDILHIIENAWSKRVTYKVYKTLPDDFRFVRNDVNGKPLYYQRLGFAYVKPAHDSTPLYLAKYMFKPEVNTPEGKNPNFYLASRKNGIGYQYIVEFRDYHRANPNVTKLDFLNKHTGKMCHFTIPQYFKDYFFPTPSKIIPDDVRKSFTTLQDLVADFNSYKSYLLQHDSLDYAEDDVNTIIKDINQKYFMYKPIKNFINLDPNQIYRDWLLNHVHKVPTEGHHIIDMFGLCFYVSNYKEEIDMSCIEYAKKNMIKSYCCILMEYEYLMSLKFDSDEMLWTLLLRDKHKAAMTQKMVNKPPISPIDAAYKLKKRYEVAKHKQYN